MTTRLLRYGLGVALALAAAAPLTAPANAMTCSPGTEAVCIVAGVACTVINRQNAIPMYCQLG